MGSSETNDPWYRSAAGVAVVAVDLLLVGALVVGTTAFAGTVLDLAGLPAWRPPMAVRVPWYVYLYAVLGATGYVFTMLVREFDRSGGELARYNLRLPAALPLAAGVYLLSDRLVGGGSQQLLGALAFATGLLINTAYLRLRDLSVRLLSPQQEATGSAGGSATGEGGDDSGSGDETPGDAGAAGDGAAGGGSDAVPTAGEDGRDVSGVGDTRDAPDGGAGGDGDGPGGGRS